jgi:outer membrane protein assembly factor BamE (lipoprotein component of BamABCDE complex)
LKPIPCVCAAGLSLLAGCNSNAPPSTPQAQMRRQTTAKLRNGMTEAEVATVLGQPTEFRPGNGTRDDVAVYRVKDQTFTIYFYQNRLTRFISSQQPVNR